MSYNGTPIAPYGGHFGRLRFCRGTAFNRPVRPAVAARFAAIEKLVAAAYGKPATACDDAATAVAISSPSLGYLSPSRFESTVPYGIQEVPPMNRNTEGAAHEWNAEGAIRKVPPMNGT